MQRTSRSRDRAGRTARALLDGEDARDLLARLEAELGDKRGELTDAFLRLKRDLDSMLNSIHPLDSVGRFVAGEAEEQVASEAASVDDPEREAELLLHVYGFFCDRSRIDLTLLVAEKERELENLVERVCVIDPANKRAVTMLNAKVAACEDEIDTLKGKLEPLTDSVRRVRTELGVILERIDAAKKAMAGKNERERAEAARQVIDRVVCHFGHVEKGRNRSPLKGVEIIPLVSDAQPFRTLSQPVRG